jgi:hypothetical protein
MTETNLDKLTKRIASLEERLGTCYGDECKLLQANLDSLKAQADQLSALERRFASFEEKVGGNVQAAVDKGFSIYEPRFRSIEENSTRPVVDTDAYWECDKCGTPFKIGYPRCPNSKCNAEILWDDLLDAAKANYHLQVDEDAGGDDGQ